VAALQIAISDDPPSGRATAIELARRGHRVPLFERSGAQLQDRGAAPGVPSPVQDTVIARALIDLQTRSTIAPAFPRVGSKAEQ